MSSWLNGKVNSWEGRVAEKSWFYFILKVKAPVSFASQFLLNILLDVTIWEWKKCFWCWSCACAWLLASSLSVSSLTISSPFHSGSRSSKTFKPKKNIPEGSHQYELLKHAEATLGSGNLRMAVMLPEGEDLNEWVAVNSKSASSSVVRGCQMWADTCGNTAVCSFLVGWAPLSYTHHPALCWGGERWMPYHLVLVDAEWLTETKLFKLPVPKICSC